MIRLGMIAVLLGLSSSVFAREFKFYFGLIDAPACFSSERSGASSVRAAMPNRYATRATRLMATVVAPTNNERDVVLLNACGKAAQAELKQVRSASNMSPFSELVAQYMRSCVQAKKPTLRIYGANVDFADRCPRA